jgi:hypothetical protein
MLRLSRRGLCGGTGRGPAEAQEPTVLASLQHYLYLWQLPLVGLVAAGWVFGGGYLLSRGLRKHAPGSGAGLGPSFAAMLLAAASAAVAGGIFYMLLVSVGEWADVPLAVPGLIVGAGAGVVMSFCVLYAVLALPARATLRAAGPALVAAIALAAGVGGVAAGFAYAQTWRERGRIIARTELWNIRVAIQQYVKDHRGAAPEALQDLADEGYLDAPHLRSPGSPDRPVGFFYLAPPPGALHRRNQQVLACDYHAHSGGRAVLLANGDVLWCDEAIFRERLKRPENAAFTQAWRAAGGE